MKQGFAQLALVALILILLTSGLAVFIIAKNKIPNQLTPSPSPQYQNNETTNTSEIDTSETIKIVESGNSNLKIFTNLKYGYSFEFPVKNFLLGEYNDRLLESSPAEGNYSSIELCSPIECVGYGNAHFRVFAFENRNNWNLNAWLTSASFSPLKKGEAFDDCINNDPRTKQTKISFLEKDSVTLEYRLDRETARMIKEGICDKDLYFEGGGFHKWIITENKGKIIAILIMFIDDKDKIQLDQILTTFRFVE